MTIGIPTYNRAELLREAIESALAQSFTNFRLLVCDNASDDRTPDVVASFADRRIHYIRSDTNVGMIANFNRIIERTESETVVLLSDDDVLYPGYLAAVLPVLENRPSVGVVHTALDLIDSEARVIRPGVELTVSRGPVTMESGAQYLDRSMRSLWTVAWSSALFRTDALREADGLRADEQPSADVPLLMRIALRWDFAMVAQPLVGVRVHPGAATAGTAGWTGTGYELGNYAEILFERRTRFLAQAELPRRAAASYRATAERTYAGALVDQIAAAGGADATWFETNRAVLNLLRRKPAALGLPSMWRLLAAQAGGRYVKRRLRR